MPIDQNGSKTPRGLGRSAEEDVAMSPQDERRNNMNIRRLGSNFSPRGPAQLGNADEAFAEQQRRSLYGERRRALTALYGTGVH